jgi:hypothetical protein
MKHEWKEETFTSGKKVWTMVGDTSGIRIIQFPSGPGLTCLSCPGERSTRMRILVDAKMSAETHRNLKEAEDDADTGMDSYTAVGIAEGFIDPEDEDQVIAAWQHLHDTGLAYQLQGAFGRQAQAMLAEGLIS